jgi:hypothetical protein
MVIKKEAILVYFFILYLFTGGRGGGEIPPRRQIINVVWKKRLFGAAVNPEPSHTQCIIFHTEQDQKNNFSNHFPIYPL